MESNTANPGTINRQYWTNTITVLEPQETPYTSMVDKTEEAHSMLVETFTDRMEPASTEASREGAPSGQGGNALRNIARHGAYQHFKQRKWAVTHHQQIVSRRGGLAGITNAADRSSARKEMELKRDMEAVNCSNVDTQDGAGGTAAMQTRGAFRWLTPAGTTLGSGATLVSTAAQATAASVLAHGNNSGLLFSEDSLYDLLKELCRIRGNIVSIDGLFGQNVISTLDHFSRIATTGVTVNPAALQTYTTRQSADEFQINLKVNIYKTSHGTINAIPEFFNQIDANGVGDANAGLLLDRTLWYLDLLEPMNEASTFKTETQEGGCWQATWVNVCESPYGNGKIVQS